ncbi:MAG: response regulator [Paludibaculum sp.]
MPGPTKIIVAAVDDDFRVRESIASLMESAGFEPLLFASAEEFLSSGALSTVTCLITDVRMPGMDGIELQRLIRRQRAGLPVIFVSAHYDNAVRLGALEEGAIEFLYKPFAPSQLLAIIDRIVSEPKG